MCRQADLQGVEAGKQKRKATLESDLAARLARRVKGT